MEKSENKANIKVKINNPKDSAELSYDEFMKTNTEKTLSFINSDNIPDYVFYGMLGQQYFFDGKSKEEIKNDIPVSKAGSTSELRIIDINCGDTQQEFIVQSAGGGTLGNYHYMDIFRYDAKTKRISSIFKYEISSFHWEETTEILDNVYYIDALYNNNKCFDTIRIYRGKFVGKAEPFKTQIKPKDLIDKFYFNKITERFEKITN